MSMPRITPCAHCGSPPTLGIDAGAHSQDIGWIRTQERENMLARIAELEKLEEPMRQVIDYCTYVQANSAIAREVLKIVKDCGL